jgi:predicted RNase H-like nuclease (RuvC/YqgF family)
VFLLSGLIRPIDAYQQYVGSRLLHLNTKVPRLEDKTEILRQEIYQTQNLVYLQDSNLSNVENSGKGNKFDRLEREIENVHSKGEQLVANIKNEESILKTLAEATTKNILEMREKTIKN